MMPRGREGWRWFHPARGKVRGDGGEGATSRSKGAVAAVDKRQEEGEEHRLAAHLRDGLVGGEAGDPPDGLAARNSSGRKTIRGRENAF